MATCNQCGLPILFDKRDGRLYPVNPDGSPHWSACKAAQHRVQPIMAIRGRTITGPGFVEFPCACSTPPWEECYCAHFWSWREEVEARAAAEMLGAS
jgi:hypothetical protein